MHNVTSIPLYNLRATEPIPVTAHKLIAILNNVIVLFHQICAQIRRR